MLTIRVVAVGTIKDGFFRDAVAEYAKRLGGKYCKFEVSEVAEASHKDTTSQIRAESQSIREKLKGTVFLCDVGGKPLSSEGLAELIERNSQTTSVLTFVIGGSHGVGNELDDVVAGKISLGNMTFPHQLFRVMLAEQIYRAFTIINGERYHK